MPHIAILTVLVFQFVFMVLIFVLLLGICFLSEEVESIMRGGDRGLRGEEGLKRVDIGKWAAVRQGGNR